MSELFDRKVDDIASKMGYGVNFSPEDMRAAEEFLSRKYPEIHQLYQLRFNEMSIAKLSANEERIDMILNDRDLSILTYQIIEAVKNSIHESIYGELQVKTSKCNSKNVRLEELRKQYTKILDEILKIQSEEN
ncbi:hypothetical protein WR25_16141 [Diploscapter pachys]|uniref:Uncharacterized protein n=1 Tax=Diploscapter pachys TaxID=2018661 RepID=A0A2A2L963_9BILA|nr:hypothetical protein WR25_16141 [Diploscapter pachys]